MTRISRLPTYFLSHGGGPWPWLEGPFRRAFDRLEASLREIPREIGVHPRAILVVSGHWEEPEFTVMASPHPPMVYDYGGFPEHTYRIRYAAPGSPQVAARTRELLEGAGIPARLDHERGFDHGVYAPLYPMYPDADVPVLQLSLKSGYDPEAHPREDHLVPLMVALGAAEAEKAEVVYHETEFFGGITVSSYRFGEVA